MRSVRVSDHVLKHQSRSSSSSSGSSTAGITASNLAGFRGWSSMKVQCTCGNPRFWNSITLKCEATCPNTLAMMMFSINSLSFNLNTLAHRSGRSCGVCPGWKELRISGQSWFQDIVRNMSGCPSLFEVAVMSWTF